MYVDSQGCVFLRAGVGGQVTWVPRVNSQRRVLCGYPPTLAARAPVAAAPVQVAEAPAPVVRRAPVQQRATGAPMQTVASLTTPPTIRAAGQAPMVAANTYTAAPVIQAAAAQPVQRVAAPAPQALASVPGPGQIGCFRSAPVPKVYATSNGGRVVLCTRGDGTLEGARAPIYAVVAQGVGNRVGAGIYEPVQGQQVAARVTAPAGGSYAAAAPVRRVAALPPLPRGYKPAWTDDRLNPNRGIGTAEGQAQQDQIWTREVPARLVAGQPTKRVWWAASSQSAPQAAALAQPVRLRASTMTEPAARVAAPAAAPAAGGSFYVQVGTFAQPANADGARARLRGAGLRVGTAKISKGGTAMQIVLAGPFGDRGAAQAALSAARGAGFGDAFIR